MAVENINRDQILNALRESLEPHAEVFAMWEGGAAAFGRVDEWSDIDVQFDVADDFSDQAVDLVITALKTLSPVKFRYDLPQPTWHGHFQTFIQLENSSPFLVIDLVIMKHSNEKKFLESAIHGEQKVHFDKKDIFSVDPFDQQNHLQSIQNRLEVLPILFGMFQVFIEKEVHRGQAIEAIPYYHSMTLRPLVELLRIHYNPQRYNFHTRYVYQELPPEIIQRLEPLFYPRDLADLASKRHEAEIFFYEELNQISLNDIQERLFKASV